MQVLSLTTSNWEATKAGHPIPHLLWLTGALIFFGLPRQSEFSCTERPVRINYFARHSVCVQGSLHNGGIQSLDWIGGLDQWTGTVDSPNRHCIPINAHQCVALRNTTCSQPHFCQRVVFLACEERWPQVEVTRTTLSSL